MTSQASVEYHRWLSSEELTLAEKDELLSILEDEESIRLRFSSPMSFGTAGLRSTMELGIGSMNRFTVAAASAAMAKLVLDAGGEKRGVAIAYDSRNNSRSFAEISACVLAERGVRAYLFNGVRPTPELSFAVRDLGAIAGINITASHNPKEYNGYKAYWEDGAQISPKQADVVAGAMGEIDPLDSIPRLSLSDGIERGIVTLLGEDYDERYLAAVLETAVDRTAVPAVSDSLAIVYTPLHGAGHRLVPEILSRMGLKKLYTVDSQMTLDGNFPTVKKPNPEYADVFADGIRIANEVGSDLVIATDPDADRIGVVCRTSDGSFKTITGNQMGALLLDYVIRGRRRQGRLTPLDYAVKSVVSTPLADAIAEREGVVLHDVLTGFKYIGEVIYSYERSARPGAFLMGFEESYGYLFGSYARDKDAVGAAMMITEMTAAYRAEGMTLCDALERLYASYGVYLESNIEIYMEGLDGIERRRETMRRLRSEPPRLIGSDAVISVSDYLSGKVVSLLDGGEGETGLPKSDVLAFRLASGARVIVRPSGTEPKIKVYLLVSGPDAASASAAVEAIKEGARALV